MLPSLLSVPLFHDLQGSQSELLQGLVEPYRCARAHLVFRQGEPAIYLYLILLGRAVLRYQPDDGPPIRVTHLQPQDAFGWSAVIGARVYTSSIVSTTGLEAIRFRGAGLRDLCVRNPELGRIVLERLAGVVSSHWINARAQASAILAEALSRSVTVIPPKS